MHDDPNARAPHARAVYSAAQILHVLRVEFHRSRRHEYPLSCLAIAVDRLDALRDRAGYEAKERVVDAVVLLLHEATRGSDTLGRTADDRFIAVVPHTDAEGARTLGRRIVERARSLRIERLPEPFSVSLSVGSASTLVGASVFHDSLLASAEEALAEASGAGGDRFVERAAAAPATPPG